MTQIPHCSLLNQNAFTPATTCTASLISKYNETEYLVDRKKYIHLQIERLKAVKLPNEKQSRYRHGYLASKA